MVARVELGVEIAQRVKAITGCPTSFAIGVTGGYGQVLWTVLTESIQQLPQANEALDANGDFAQLLDARAATA